MLVLQPNYEELVESSKTPQTLKSNEEDIINLTLLGVVHMNKSLLKSIKYFQTDFSKKVISDIVSLVNDTSVEEVARKFHVSWEIIFYLQQEPLLTREKISKKVNYTQVKGIFRPSKCLEAVKDFLAGKVTKDQVLKTHAINESSFDIWLRLFRDPVPKQIELSHIPNKEKLKLVSCYLTGKLTISEIEYSFWIPEAQIHAWAIYFCMEKKVYQRERIITAQEKYDVLQRYFKGEYTVSQFQNDYGIRANLLYGWVRQVQSGKPLTSSNIFRTASDDLEQAYNIFLDLYKD
jgi:transposase-like protein